MEKKNSQSKKDEGSNLSIEYYGSECSDEEIAREDKEPNDCIIQLASLHTSRKGLTFTPGFGVKSKARRRFR